jgi:hypothetical protein
MACLWLPTPISIASLFDMVNKMVRFPIFTMHIFTLVTTYNMLAMVTMVSLVTLVTLVTMVTLVSMVKSVNVNTYAP